ncbi:MAG: pathogenicity protein [Rhodanobacter sp.]|nr:MAG: pathogenicity protein [Rhodanobacter sp.]
MTETSKAPVTTKRRRWPRRLGLALLLVLVLLGSAIGWLLGTGSGLRFALSQARSASAGALTVQRAQGRLIGPLQLHGVRYRQADGLDVQIADLRLNLAFWPLLRQRLHVLDLQLDGVDVALPPASPNAPGSSGGFSLTPPVDLLLDRVQVEHIAIRRDGKPLFVSRQLLLAGAWSTDGLVVRQLELQAADGHATLKGKLLLGGTHADHYRGDGSASFSWKLDGSDYAGSVQVRSDGRQATVDAALSQPVVAHLKVQLAQSGTHAWTATLNAPRFDPRPLLGPGKLTAMALSLHGSGDQHSGSVNGEIELNGYQLRLAPLRARFGEHFETLQLQQLAITSPQIPGSLDVSGRLQLNAKPLGGTLQIDWRGLQLPVDLAGQKLASHGSLRANGNLERFRATIDGELGPPGKPAALKLALDGTPQRIALKTLNLKQPQGQLQISGVLQLKPALAWQASLQGRRFDPGQLLAGWPGALDFDIDSHGTAMRQGVDARVEIRQLHGRLRQRPVRASGNVHLAPNKVIDGNLDLTSGASTIHLRASRGASNHATVKLSIASLGDWLPAASGRLDGQFVIAGNAPRLSLNGTMQGTKLAYRQQRIDRLKVIVGIPNISHPSGMLDVQGEGVHVQGLLFQQLKLHAEGSQASHRLTLNVRGRQLSGALRLDGSRRGSTWTGSLSTLTIEPQGLPAWHLQQPAKLAWRRGAMRLSELCLSAGDPLLCVAASQDAAGNLDVSYRLRALPLALLLNAGGLAELPIRADGSLQGDGSIRRSARGVLSGKASIQSAQGLISYTDQPAQPLLSYHQLALDATLGGAHQQVTIAADLDQNGRLDGKLEISGKQQALQGQVALKLHNLAFVELLTSELAKVSGQLDGHFTLGGTLAHPAVTGQATMDRFAAEVPAAGLKLREGHVVLSTGDAKTFRLDGTVKSGQGTLALNGTATLGSAAHAAITLKGRQFTAADIPAARVVVSPDLLIAQNAQGIDITGKLALDSANVDLAKLPGAGAASVSADVVVVDQKQQQVQQKQMPISAAVTIDLGKQAHIVGMGLNGNLQGQLKVIQQPGHAPIGQGQVAIDGTYKAYGQDLDIERGQLLFASTPLDNPGLNIRAVRKLNPNATIDQGQKVGLYIAGTAQRPILTVFSNPVMEQSDALSYLITGKPLSQLKGGQGSMVSSAAQALGSAGGNLLAKQIGSRLGIDDIGVSSNAALGGNSAFTVGKYLSPRLYLSYGVGLFQPGQVITLRYRLSKRWDLETENATDFNRASLNYRYEK